MVPLNRYQGNNNGVNMSEQYYKAGAAAFKAGFTAADCPHQFDYTRSPRSFWMNGFNDAMKGKYDPR